MRQLLKAGALELAPFPTGHTQEARLLALYQPSPFSRPVLVISHGNSGIFWVWSHVGLERN